MAEVSNLKCDICKAEQNEVLILRHWRFTPKGSKHKKLPHRVCLRCARGLVSRREYDFGSYWVSIFHYWASVIK